MSKILVVGERLAELHEAVKYANSHGNGVVTIKADELAELLPGLPVEVKPDVPAAEPVPVAAEHGETISQAASAPAPDSAAAGNPPPAQPTSHNPPSNEGGKQEVNHAEGTGETGAENDPTKPPTVQ